ncbi:MAG: aldo/keto reductase [Cyanobacteria bacterium J06621_8]
MNKREFGRSGIKLSPVTFGSMRLAPERIELEAAVDLITFLYESGVNTFHSSHEYATDPFFCEVMRQFRSRHPGAEVVHIAKIGVPHFDEASFKGEKLVTLIEQRLKALDTEQIALVQWLVRHQPNDDLHRLPLLAESQSELTETWSKLHQEGKVGALASFPYSIPFAEAVLQLSLCQGLVTYLNLLELEMVPLLKEMVQQGQGYVAIRPLGGGAITSAGEEPQQLKLLLKALDMPLSELTKLAVQFPLLYPAVASVMVSVSSISHGAEIIEAANVASDRQKFQQILNLVNSSCG